MAALLHKFEFCQIKLEYGNMSKVAICWQNFAQVRLQFKFAFGTWAYLFYLETNILQ